MAENQSVNNAEPLKYALDFEIYLQTVFNNAAGMTSSLKQLNNGQYVVEFEEDRNAEAVCNTKGARHIVSNLRLILNRHAALGNLKQDEIAIMAGNVVKATITPMFVWNSLFGVRSNSILENFGLNLFESLYAFLTSMKDAGIKNFGAQITTVQYVQKPVQAQEQGLYS